jgi:ABC-type antimicrobial peptide transport system permease subunit
MLKNYFKTAYRRLIKNRFSSLLNISGLAVGIAVVLLNSLWIIDELSFNKNHENYNRIAKVTKRGINNGKLMANTWLPLPLADELKTNYGQYFDHVLLSTEIKEGILAEGETKLSMKGLFIEPAAPTMFSLKMLKGTGRGLEDQQSILISAAAAKALFGNADPINKVIQVNTNMDAKIAGVFEDLPRNSEFNEVKFFAPFDLWVAANPWVKKQGWDNQFINTYVQVKQGVDISKVSALVKDAEYNQIKNMENMEHEVSRNMRIWLLPMKDWHLRSDLSTNEPVQMVWMIGMIGAFVLLLACINFMNLATARSEKRAKEIGIRKVVGSMRGQLIKSFFTESILIVSLAFVLAFLMVTISLPWFNGLAAKEMVMPLGNPWFWIVSFCFIILTGLIAGSYPALYLSSFRPIKVLKGSFRVGRFASLPRKALVVVQFTVSVALIIGTIIVYQQIQFAKNRPIGYDRNRLLLIEKKTGEFYGKFNALKTELDRTGVVSSMAESRSSTTDITMWNGGFSYKGREIKIDGGSGTLSVTSDYGKTVGWNFIAGRDFSESLTSDSSGFVINESFAKAIGLENPVGETIKWDPGWKNAEEFVILGVVKDMVAMSPYEPAVPTVFFLSNKYHTWYNIRLNTNVGISQALAKIEAVFKKIIPSAPFDYKFADQEYELKFAAEERIGKLAWFFSVLAIFISCLGLFGLASFIAEQRKKEIGIRKVLGASVTNLWQLLSKDFVLLVIISSAIAIPIAWYFLSGWLQKYQYRTAINWWIFASAIGSALLIAVLTVSFQAIKAAISNPVKSLRTE